MSNGEILSGLSEPAVTIILSIAIIFGFVLLFAGKLLWKPIMSIIGGFMGASMGFGIASAFSANIFIWLIGAIIGGLLGSFFFGAFVEFAISLLAGIVVFGIAFINTGNAIIALILAAVVFIGSIIFIKKIISVLTAIIGGLLVGMGLYGLNIVAIEIAAGITLALIVLGSVVQIFLLKEKKPPSPAQQFVCSRCGANLAQDPQTGSWYCTRCDLPPPPPPPEEY